MGIVSKQKEKQSFLSLEDLEFILHKLREAPYTGHEFEKFYAVWTKLTAKHKELKK